MAPPPFRLLAPLALLALLLLAGEAWAQTQPSRDQAAMARAQVRINNLEEELRRVRGALEEEAFARQRLEDELGRLRNNLDARLRVLEGETPGDGAAALPEGEDATDDGAGGERLPERLAATAPNEAPPPPEEPQAAQDEQAPASVELDRAAREGYVLGSIPRNALLGIDPPSGATAGTTAGGTSPPTGGARPRYQAALALLQEGDHGAARVALERFLNDFPDDPNAPSAAYWLGESHYLRGDYAEAAARFAGNFRAYGPEASRAPDNLLKLGASLSSLGDSERACQALSELSRRYPDLPDDTARRLQRERAAAGCG